MSQELRENNLILRARIIRFIREFFEKRGYLEVETPFILPSVIPELHIDAIKTEMGFLHTSPELCMKILLSKGYGNIFQICKCFRKGEKGKRHLPEFTMLEWYHLGVDYNGIMEECERLIYCLCIEIFGKDKITYMGKEIDLSLPWERITLEEAFERYASVPLRYAIDKGIFEEVLVNEIEKRLTERPVFLKDWPVEMAALSKLRGDIAERFELYIAGIEIANGYTELIDLGEIKKRVKEENEKRCFFGKEKYPISDEFFRNFEKLPDCAGIALGIDRLIMIFSNTDDIKDTVSLTYEEISL